ncbi:hypothetical protein [Promineifilum sp.]|uniref:hypothetical protein n=1 Tax=Promineifilum sp. TaxID=2664178 RepID=UPI0035AEEBE9
METMEQKLQAFFAKYEARTNRALAEPPVVDVEATAAAFADYVVQANPNGVSGGANDETFRAVIPQGFAFYRAIGTEAMNITGLAITPLDEQHSMTRVHWRAHYARPDGRRDAIDFDVIYFVQVRDETPRIFAYITGDEEKVYRERGLI